MNSGPQLRSLILKKLNSLEDIPAQLDNALELERLLLDYKTSAEQLVELIRLDPALTAKVFKVVGSAGMAGVKQITDLRSVIIRLGFDEIRRIILAVAVLNSFTPRFVNYKVFWLHSLTVAFLTEKLHTLAKTESGNPAAYTCGLLHDIGIIVLDQTFPELYRRVFMLAGDKQCELHALEKEILGIDHAEVGALLMERWGLPKQVVEVLRWHHQPGQTTDSIHNNRLVYVADFIATNRGLHTGGGCASQDFDDSVWQELGINVDNIPQIINDTESEVIKAKELIKIGGK